MKPDCSYSFRNPSSSLLSSFFTIAAVIKVEVEVEVEGEVEGEGDSFVTETIFANNGMSSV